MRTPLVPGHTDLAERFYQQMLRLKPGTSRTTRTSEQRHINEVSGKLAEICLGFLLGLAVDWTARPWTDSDNGIDFTLPISGRTIDCKAVQVNKNMNYDYKLTVKVSDLKAFYLVLVLIAPDRTYGDVVGVVSRRKFLKNADVEKGWAHMGRSQPRVLRRSLLNQDFESFLRFEGIGLREDEVKW